MVTAWACVSGAPLVERERDRTSERFSAPIIPAQRSAPRSFRSVLGAACIAALGASAAVAQTGGGSVFQRLNLDKLQLYALGASAGPIMPSQVVSTTVYGLGADYGEISRNWRVIFG